jgi:hypothetical protein
MSAEEWDIKERTSMTRHEYFVLKEDMKYEREEESL